MAKRKGKKRDDGNLDGLILFTLLAALIGLYAAGVRTLPFLPGLLIVSTLAVLGIRSLVRWGI